MKGHNSVLGGGGLHHLAIRAADFDAAVKFYTRALGFKEKIRWGEGNQRAIMLDIGDGNSLEIFAGGSPGPKPEGAILHFALRTADCDAALSRAVAAGAVTTLEPREVSLPTQPHPTAVRIAFCRAPDGEIIEFLQEELK